MLTKQAQEEIYTYYYNLGIQQAMEKIANPLFINAAKLTNDIARSVAQRSGGASGLAGEIAGALRTAGKTQSKIPFTGGAKARKMLEGAGLGRIKENPIYAQNVNRMGISNLAGESRAAPGLMGARPGEVMTLPKARLEYNALQKDILGNPLAPSTRDILSRQDLSRKVMGTGELRPELASELSRLPSEAELLASIPNNIRRYRDNFRPGYSFDRHLKNRFDYRPTRREALDGAVRPMDELLKLRKDL